MLSMLTGNNLHALMTRLVYQLCIIKLSSYLSHLMPETVDIGIP